MNTLPSSTEIIQSRILTLARFDYTAAEKTIMSHLVKMMQVLLDGQSLDDSLCERVRHEDFFQKGVKITCNLMDLGASRENWNVIRHALIKLNERKFEIDNDKKWKIIRLVEMPEIEKGSGEVSFVLHKELVQAFLTFSIGSHRKGFSRFDIGVSLSLSSIYSRRLYEMVANGETFELSINKFKEIFKVENKYRQNRDFILRCIELPKRELDAKSPWSFDYEVKKSSRRFIGIKITPINILKNEPDDMKQKQIARQDRALLFLPGEAKNYLLQNGWSKKELQNNRQLFIDASKVSGKGFVEWCREKWQKANELKHQGKVTTSKGWFIGALKGLVKEEKS